LWSIGDSSTAALLHKILTEDEACVAASLIFGEFLMVSPLIPSRPIARRHKALRGTLTERRKRSPRSAAVTTSAGGRCRGDQESRIEFRIGIIVGDVVAGTATFSATPSTTPHASKVWPSQAGIWIWEDAFRQVRGKVEAEFADIGENIALPEIFNTTKGRSSPVWRLPADWKPLGYGSAWTAAGAGWTTSLSSDCGTA
jgi:hypothetical protein